MVQESHDALPNNHVVSSGTGCASFGAPPAEDEMMAQVGLDEPGLGEGWRQEHEGTWTVEEDSDLYSLYWNKGAEPE